MTEVRAMFQKPPFIGRKSPFEGATYGTYPDWREEARMTKVKEDGSTVEIFQKGH